MTLFEFITIIKRHVIWVLLIGILAATGAYLYIAPKEDRVTLLIKCYPNDQYKKKIAHIAPAIHDLFKKRGSKNISNYEVIDEFIDKYNVQTVRQTKSSVDTLNIWFKVIFDDADFEYNMISNEFIELANHILLEHSIISEQLSSETEELLRPLFPDKPYTDVSLKTITPWKGALIVFVLSFIFTALFLAVIEDIKKHRSSSTH